MLTALVMMTLPVAAHHGWGGNGEEEFELVGKVESGVSLAGPHATMKVHAEEDRCGTSRWRPVRARNAGLKEGVIPVGAQVTDSRPPQSDPKKFEVKTERVTWNGKTFNVYPDRK